MSKRADIDGRLVYTCNCGWVDKGHANSKATRPHVGAASLWDQLTREQGMKSEAEDGYLVMYTQDMGKIIVGVPFMLGSTGMYFVKRGLSRDRKEQVALAIFMEISQRFEGMQESLSWLTDSGFSEEDLVSDLIGFYIAVRPGVDYLGKCQPVSKEASLKVWDDSGAVGANKNKTFEPKFHNCSECKGKPQFPAELQAIKPAQKGPVKTGQDFRDWNMDLDAPTLVREMMKMQMQLMPM